MHYAIRVPDAGQNHADIWSQAVLSCLKAAINGPMCESKFCSLMCLTSGRVSQVVAELCTVRHHLKAFPTVRLADIFCQGCSQGLELSPVRRLENRGQKLDSVVWFAQQNA